MFTAHIVQLDIGWLYSLFFLVGATLGGVALNLVDWAKRLDPDGSTSVIAELLNQTNDVLLDMQWMEGNLPTGHRVTVRTGLPTAAWRLLNQGVTPSKSTTAQIDEAAGMLEAFSSVDRDLADLNGNTADFRLSEGMAFIEAMNQQMVQTLFYGDTTVNPERFLGLAARYSTISGAANGQNVLSQAGASSNNTSVWLIVWGPNTISGIFPKGSKAGLIHEDLGLETVQTGLGITGGLMRAYQDHWQWKCGIALKDWRYVVRLCNISVSDLVASATTQNAQQLINGMSRMLDRIPSFGMGKPAFYMTRTVFSMLRIQALAKSNAALSIETALDQFGNPVRGGMAFFGIPIRRVDQILGTEATIS
jgi:hypothetical protein